MDNLKTPIRNKQVGNKIVWLPPSPLLQQIGYGTGVGVFKYDRLSQTGKFQSPWAVKKILPKFKNSEYQRRLKHEADILRKLDHENVIGYRGLMKSKDGTDSLAMEACSKCLGDLIEERGESTTEPFPASNIMKVAFDISKALQYLHEVAFLLHGDIKSFNILIKNDFELCKLCDFGLAMPIDKEGNIDNSKVNKDYDCVGTELWCAPEILNYPPKITTKGDIYAYGLVLWEMMALSVPSNDADSSCSLDTSDSDDNFSYSRQKLPDFDFDDSYLPVIELFYCCTEFDYLKRPSAHVIVDHIKKFI